ncbi:MAG: hypothetical protein GEV03_21075 [Streptosporangiales bacterium]|nr:hypothetical protein [Streptosporangiales bacterium]
MNHEQPDGPKLPDQLPVKVHTMQTVVQAVGGQEKVARYRDFEIWCDEPEYLGGEDKHPQPLTYLAAAVGF